MLETRWSGLARSTTKINRGMNESADVSPLLIFRSKPYSKIPVSKQSIHNVSGCCTLLYSPNMTLQQFRMQITLSRGARYPLIFKSSA